MQETRWPEANIVKSREYLFYYIGKRNGPREFGFVVVGEARDAVIVFQPFDDRLCSLRIR